MQDQGRAAEKVLDKPELGDTTNASDAQEDYARSVAANADDKHHTRSDSMDSTPEASDSEEGGSSLVLRDLSLSSSTDSLSTLDADSRTSDE